MRVCVHAVHVVFDKGMCTRSHMVFGEVSCMHVSCGLWWGYVYMQFMWSLMRLCVHVVHVFFDEDMCTCSSCGLWWGHMYAVHVVFDEGMCMHSHIVFDEVLCIHLPCGLWWGHVYMQFMWSLMRTCVHALHVVFANQHMLLRSKKRSVCIVWS